MLVYHGTSHPVAAALAANPSTVSVSAGGGELGQGFYAGDSVAMAAAWARGKYPGKPGVLEISINVSSYVQLVIHTLNINQVVITWTQLQAWGKTRTFRFGYDVIYGPLATYAHVGQHKFESTSAETVLRKSAWRIV